jgi:hypothetical protein
VRWIDKSTLTNISRVNKASRADKKSMSLQVRRNGALANLKEKIFHFFSLDKA